MEKKIGVLGGMGPMASQLFYGYITEMTDASCDQDHVKLMIYSDTGMPDRTTAILEKDYEKVYSRMLEDARILEKCGCDAIAITCNTAHFFANMIADKLNIPIIHMISKTSEAIAEKYPGAKVAVLATDGTIKTRLYQDKLSEYGLLPYAPTKSTQKKVMYQIYDRVKSGLVHDKDSWKLIEKEIIDEGCDKAILGCTELSIVRDEAQLSSFYVDPMRILAKEVILFSGNKLKADYMNLI